MTDRIHGHMSGDALPSSSFSLDLDAIVGQVMSREAVSTGVRFLRETYSPHQPTPRQQLFLDLTDEEEVFYGGAAGGGKSDALLMAACEYVHIPDYSALLLRKTFKDLALPGALMDRAHGWFKGIAEWSSELKRWRFPGGGSITFGHLESERDKLQYQSAEFQFIGFDELTQFTETQYTFLFSRLRRPDLASSALGRVPLRMRSASNPPHDPSGLWVKARFIPDGFRPDDAEEERVWHKEYRDEDTGEMKKRFFVPARLDDNPHIDRASYDRSLSRLDPVTRAQLRRGDWQIAVTGDILFDWSEETIVVPWSRFQRALRLRHPRIPHSWQIGVWQDWGATREHPCVTGWFTTASEDTPPIRFRDEETGKVTHEIDLAGSVFWYRTYLKTTGNRASLMKKIIVDLMEPDHEISRCNTWEMSHEALSERNEYLADDDETGISLPFSNWQAGYTRGIEQLKSAIAVKHVDEPHPFNPGVWGRPKLYLLVDDARISSPEQVYDGLDLGQWRARTEAPAYKWDSPKSGEAPKKLRPYPLFNDAMDIARAAAASLFPEVKELTPRQILARRIRRRAPYLQRAGNGDILPLTEGRQISAAIVRAQEMRRIRAEYDIDESLEGPASELVDIRGGW